MADMNEAQNHAKEKAGESAKESVKVEKIDVDKLEAEAELGATQAEISADIMKTAEVAEESGEGFGEDEQQGKAKQSSGGKKDEASPTQIKAHIHATIPQNKMRKDVAKEIRKEIRKEERKVFFAYTGIKRVSPHKLAEMVARIRNLRDVLASLLHATKEVLAGLYMKWVRKEG